MRPLLPALLFPGLLPGLLLGLLLAAPVTAPAHPHAFVEAHVTLAFDDQGLAGIHQRWVMDEMLAASVLDLVHEDGDGVLSKAEADAIERQSFRLLKEYNYFNHIRIDGKPFAVQWARDFSVTMDGNRMIYEFLVPCHVAAGPRDHEVLVAVFDDSFYTYVTYGDEDSPSIDPTMDPQYADPSAPARPGDFKRFAESVRLGAYAGGVRVSGPTKGLRLRTRVAEMPSMTYYFDQIVPEALIVEFSRP